MTEDPINTLFIGNKFLTRMFAIVAEGKAAVLAPELNRQMPDWKAKEDERFKSTVETGAKAVEGLIAGLNGIGVALERIAAAQEKLAALMNIDLDATIQAAVNENLASAVEQTKENDAKRSFIGKPA